MCGAFTIGRKVPFSSWIEPCRPPASMPSNHPFSVGGNGVENNGEIMMEDF
jgi:hypothetical protein